MDKERGWVYLLHSKEYPDTYKIGKTTKDHPKQRLKEIKKDNRYGLFNFELISFFETKNCNNIENLAHNKFHDFRIHKKNGGEANTELFKINNSINFTEQFNAFMKEILPTEECCVKELYSSKRLNFEWFRDHSAEEKSYLLNHNSTIPHGIAKQRWAGDHSDNKPNLHIYDSIFVFVSWFFVISVSILMVAMAFGVFVK